MNRDRNNRNPNFKSRNNRDNRGGKGPFSGPPKAHNDRKEESIRPVNRGGAEGQDQFKRYEKLCDDVHRARLEYFEKFHRVDDNRRNNLERKYYDLLDQLRHFENTLPDWQKSKFIKDQKEHRPDLEYTLLHPELENEQIEIPKEKIEPHLSQMQIRRESYKNDTEESIGTMEDYNLLKGV